MDLKKLIENLQNTLEKNGYTLEDLKQELCDCGNEEGGSYEHGETKEEKEINNYNDNLENIMELEDKKERIRELKRLLQDLKQKYHGNASKEIKKLYARIKKLLEAEEKGKNKTSNNMMR